LLLAVVDQAAQVLRRDALHHAREQLDGAELAHRRWRRGPAPAAAKGKLPLGVGKLALELAALVEERGNPLDELVGTDL
jgi:hypothetical protein